MKRYTVIIEYLHGRKNKLVAWAEDEEKAKRWCLRSWGNPTNYKSLVAIEG